MVREYNETTFTPEEVEKGLHLDLLNTLLKFNKESEDYYNDIHITTDSYCTIVQWIQRDYEHEFEEGRFEFFRNNQTIVNEVHFPDGHYEHLLPDITKDYVNKWLEENKEEFGNYYYNETCNIITEKRG